MAAMRRRGVNFAKIQPNFSIQWYRYTGWAGAAGAEARPLLRSKLACETKLSAPQGGDNWSDWRVSQAFHPKGGNVPQLTRVLIASKQLLPAQREANAWML